MAVEPTAPCPHCKAENMAHRRECWRCRRTLPTSFALDAGARFARIGRAAPPSAPPPTPAEIQAALDQAIIIGERPSAETEETSAPPEGAGGVGKRLLWLLGKRMHA
jgi:hypothetical protein